MLPHSCCDYFFALDTFGDAFSFKNNFYLVVHSYEARIACGKLAKKGAEARRSGGTPDRHFFKSPLNTRAKGD
jgi:hypothetical protein